MLLQLGQSVTGTGDVHTTTGDHDRGLGGAQQLCRSGDLIGSWSDPVKGEVSQGCPSGCRRRRCGRAENIAGQQEDHRARAPGTGHADRHVQVVIHPGRVVQSSHPLRDGREQGGVVELLERVAVPVGGRNILHQRQDRHGDRHRLGERWDEKGCRWAVLGGHDADTTRGPGVAVGHGAARVFGAVRDLPDPVSGGGQEQGRRQALTENVGDAVACKSGGQCLGDGGGGHWYSFGCGCPPIVAGTSPRGPIVSGQR